MRNRVKAALRFPGPRKMGPREAVNLEPVLAWTATERDPGPLRAFEAIAEHLFQDLHAE